MEVRRDRTYRLRNRQYSDKYLCIANFADTKVTIWRKEENGAGRKAESWYFFPLGNKEYVIAQLSRGLLLTPNEFKQDATTVWLYKPVPEKMQGQIMQDAGDGYITLQNGGGSYLTVDNENRWEVTTYSQLDDHNQRSQHWMLEELDSLPDVKRAEDIEVHDSIGDVMRLEGFKPPAKRTTREVLVGKTLLPYPLVADRGIRDPKWQAKNSPYYVLKRYGYWRCVADDEKPGNVEETVKKVVTVGTSKTQASSVEETTGISVTAEAEFKYSGFSAKLSTTISNELKVSRSQSATNTTTREDTQELKFPAGKRTYQALWLRGDRFDLERLDGSVALSWESLDGTSQVRDAWPKA
ncbi:hypothetical protein [Streptomyces sp. NPDC046939]|uniref:hypothetical protein n=1 Tax=Streptomyces sp. NPDC046939 TaxID=3155376 RepID=UPI0033C996BB